MNVTRLAFGLLVALTLTAPLDAQPRPSRFMARYGWRSNLDDAKAEAKKTGKPIFLVFRCEP